jgi:hypothetical protein
MALDTFLSWVRVEYDLNKIYHYLRDSSKDESKIIETYLCQTEKIRYEWQLQTPVKP